MKVNFPAIIITSIAAYAIPKLFGAKKFIDNLKIELKSISINTELIKQSKYKSLFYNVNLVVINPVNFDVTIDAIFIDIYFNNKIIAKANTTKKYLIAANKKSIIPVVIGTEIASLPGNIYSSFIEAYNNNNAELKIVGQLNIKQANLKFTFNQALL